MTGKDSIIKFMDKWLNNRAESVLVREQYNPTMREIDAFMRGEQWDNAVNRPKWIQTPVTNILFKIKNAKISNISETKLVTKLLPQFQGDVENIEKMQHMMDSYWNHSGVVHKINEVKVDSRTMPIGYLKIKFDGSALVGTKNNIQKGDFDFSVVKPTNVFWDSKATAEEECDFMFQTHVVTLGALKNTKKYNQDVVNDIEEYIHSLANANDDTQSGEILNRNYSLNNGYDGLSGDNTELLLYEISYRWKPSPGSDYRYGEIHTVSEGTQDEDSMENIPLFAKDNLKIKRHFIIPLREYKNIHEFMGKSTIQVVLDNQKSINRADAVIENVALQLSNSHKIIAKGSGINPKVLTKYGQAPGLVIVTNMDINNSIKYMDGQKIDENLVKHKEIKKQEAYDIANINSAFTGESPRSLTTSTGVNSLIGQSRAMETEPRDNYKLFIEKVYRTMLEYIVGNLGKITKRIDNHDPDLDAEFAFEDFDMKDFKDLAFDMKIDVRMTQSEIMEQKQEVMQILQIQSQTGVKILSEPTIIELMNFPDKDRLLATYYEDKEKTEKQKEMQIATQAALILAQEIHSGEIDDVDLQTAAQLAAKQAVEQVEEGQGGPQNQAAIKQGAGANAPQPQAQSAAIQQK